MGVAESVALDSAFVSISSWRWSKVQKILQAYADGEYEFCIDADTLANLTSMSDNDTRRIVALLSDKTSGLVNALIVLICIVLIGDSSQPNVDMRLEALFDLMDFSGVSSISMEESTILLILISTAMGTIVNKKDDVPSDEVLQCASNVIYEVLDKSTSEPLLKSEFILWATSILDELPTNKLDSVFNLVFIKGVGITGNAGSKKHTVNDEPELPDYRKEEQENTSFRGDVVSEQPAVSGLLIVKSIKLQNLRHGEMYVTLRVGDGSEWAQSTDISESTGDVQWENELDEMSGNVECQVLARNVINLTVKDSNDTTADKYVGKAKIITEPFAKEKNKWVTLSGELRMHDSEERVAEYCLVMRYNVSATLSNDNGDHSYDLSDDD